MWTRNVVSNSIVNNDVGNTRDARAGKWDSATTRMARNPVSAPTNKIADWIRDLKKIRSRRAKSRRAIMLPNGETLVFTQAYATVPSAFTMLIDMPMRPASAAPLYANSTGLKRGKMK